MKKMLLMILGLISTTTLQTAPLDLSDTPLFLTDKVSPLTMLVIGRDHKLYFEAYNDSSDVDGDGTIDIRFNPKIDYFGYFDPYKCYNYNSSYGFFSPSSVTSDKTCSGNWSGNFLNYLTTARLDAIRKILYGGYRVFDSNSAVILERTYIPQDAHSWGKEYTSPAVDGYDISQYTPYAVPTSGRHLFANTTLRLGTGAPLLRVSLNQPYRVWEWLSIERPVAGSRAINGGNGPFLSNITDFSVRVQVCDSSVGLEDNCQTYSNGSHKPIGLLQRFGENDSMYFGLITGTYNNNLQGGVLRKNISSFTDEVDLNTGQFTSVNGIVSTLNKLTVTGFGTNYVYDCGFITTRKLNNGECQMWGNPLGEMMFEAVRYFAGKSSPTSAFTYSGGTDATLGLPNESWQNPYATYPRCSKPNLLVISDIYPNYDSDQVPGSYFNAFSSDLSPALNASSISQSIFSGEGFGVVSAFIGQSAGSTDGAPTPKPISSFGNIRGLAPHDANIEGSYYSASVAHYGLTNDVNSAEGSQNIASYMVGLSSPFPEIKFNVGGNPVTIIPFGKSVKGSGINAAEGSYQPNNNVVDFYIESLSDTSGVFRVNFEDVQQGADFDMDAIVKYNITVNADNTITIQTDSVYAAGGITQHMGYIISGTEQDGIYLEVRDLDTVASNDVDYFLDTPPGQPPGGSWEDNAALPTNTTRTFKPSSSTSAAVLLNSPLFYSAKWGGFKDSNNNNIPDLQSEFDSTGDGVPDNYYLVTNANNLESQLEAVFSTIIEQTGSFASAALSSGFLSSDTRIYQSFFNSDDWSGQLLSFSVDPSTGDIETNGTGPNGAVWDAGEKLDIQNFNNGRVILTYKPSSGIGVPFRWPSTPSSPGTNEIDSTQVQALNLNPVTGVSDALGDDRLEFIRGNRTLEQQNGGTFRDRDRVLGDIINSTPIFVGAPRQEYPEIWPTGDAENNVSYAAFKQTNINRQQMIYAGANDGTLHGFNAETGSELIAYVPSKIYDNLAFLTSENYTHKYYVDGPPNVIDVFINNQWRSILVAGLNGGGQGIYALDVTDPSIFSENNASSIVKWEFTDLDDADLGFTYSQPSVVRLANGQWAAIFGNGYNNTVADGNASLTGNGVIYIVNIDTGALIKKFDTEVGMNDDPLGLSRPNGIATPTVVDTDGDSIANFIYAGDLFGNVWKIDISSSNPNQWDFAFKQGRTSQPLFVAQDSNGNRQPITIKPTVSRLQGDPSGIQVYIGTGKYLETSDKTDLNVQSIYALRDTNTTVINSRSELRAQTILQEEDGVRVTSENLLANNDRGWYMDLIVDNNAEGERIISNLVFRNDVIIFSTLIPTNDPCDFGGTGWLMELNAFTGTRLNYNVFDLNNDGGFDANDSVEYTAGGTTTNVSPSGIESTVGLITTPAIISAGDTDYKYLSGTSGNIQKIGENPGAGRYGRQSWRQLR